MSSDTAMAVGVIMFGVSLVWICFVIWWMLKVINLLEEIVARAGHAQNIIVHQQPQFPEVAPSSREPAPSPVDPAFLKSIDDELDHRPNPQPPVRPS